MTHETALITISTRASLKRYHDFNLMLGMGDNGDEWEFDRIGTEREKMQVEKELADLKERMAQVSEWKRRRDEIERELAQVWVEGGGGNEEDDEGRDGDAQILEEPAYATAATSPVAEMEMEFPALQ